MMMDALISQADIEGKVIEVIEATEGNYGCDEALKIIKKIQTESVFEGTLEINEGFFEEKICVLLFIYHDNHITTYSDLKK